MNALPKRSEVPVELTWDLSSIYASQEAWDADFERALKYPPMFAQYKGKLSRSGRLLLEVLRLSEEASQKIGLLYQYAHLHNDEDTTNSFYSGLVTRCRQLSSDLAAATSWIDVQILKIKQATLERFFSKVPGLDLYRHQIDELNRSKAHMRSAEVEEVLAQTSEPLAAAGNIYKALDNADMKLPIIELPNGEKVQLSDGNFGTKFLDSTDAETRRRGFEGMMGAYAAYRNTCAASYAGSVATELFRTRVRGYKSTRQRALDAINVPESVYDNLLSTVEANLPLLHRYLELRKRVLGVKELHMYDLYVPLVPNFEWPVTWEEAKPLVLEAVAPLGSEYVSILRNGLNSRWTDVVENAGKRSGAYSSGTYGTNPYMLLNWHNSLQWLFTLAHEAGHSMHSFFSRRKQPYPYAGYTLFVAEVASTCNEELLAHHLMKKALAQGNEALYRYIVNEQLEGVRTTLIRQTLFAEFEHLAHAAAQAGEALTPDMLSALYMRLVTKYYGATCIIDPCVANEWARIPHFYRRFYVYQYATDISAAKALSRRILTLGQPAVDDYLNFLSSGSSDYSIPLLQKAGVDMTTSAPVQAAFDDFRDNLAKLEAVL